MREKVRVLIALIAAILILVSCADMGNHTDSLPSVSLHSTPPQPAATHYPDAIVGKVYDDQGPVEGAVVRVQTTEHMSVTDENGAFRISNLGLPSEELHLTAWASGYFCSGPAIAGVGDSDVSIVLVAHGNDDNPDYEWLPSLTYPGEGESQGCAECHSRTGTNLSFSLPVDEWVLDAHSQSVQNPRFLTMYNGTDMDGNQSPTTRRGTSRDYGSFPLPPDPSKPYFGPGYKLDFPDTAGNCGACHFPAAAVNNAYGVDPGELNGVEAEGVPCDFCHKIWDVKIDPDTRYPAPNMPGVLSMEFRRPEGGHQFFAGPFDDVAPGEDTYSEIQTRGEFCAPCHFGVFWDTVVYNSFGEWLESPYSDPDTGKTCQDCHMPPLGATQFATTDAGGLQRDPDSIYSHRMPGALDEGLLKDALELRVTGLRDNDRVIIDVALTNDNTGHNIPTDSPLRNLLLVVQAFGSDGKALDYLNGPVLPRWAGEGDPDDGYYADLPGKGYALILKELWTDVSPTGAYWNPTTVVDDSRLKPLEEDNSRYVFEVLNGDEATIEVDVIFRRAFIELIKQKGWEILDISIANETIVLK